MLSFTGLTQNQSTKLLENKNKTVSSNIEEMPMVKLRFDKSKRKYKNDKKIYAYDRITLVFPREYHDLLKAINNFQYSLKKRMNA